MISLRVYCIIKGELNGQYPLPDNKLGDKEELTLKIVGSSEADMGQSKVSHESPMGRAMIGSSKGDTFFVKTSKGMVKYRVVDIV